MTPLRRRFLEDLELKGLRENTQQAYVRAVAQFAQLFGKSPERLGREQIRTYLLYLVREKRVSKSTYRQAVSAIRFLYRTTLGKDWLIEGIRHPKSETKLPVVLSMHEVDRCFEALGSLKYRAGLLQLGRQAVQRRMLTKRRARLVQGRPKWRPVHVLAEPRR